MRIIMHIDADAFYPTTEAALHPELAGKPIAVAGDPKKRNGIILSANYIARRNFGVKTASTIAEAKKVCPNIILIPPHFRDYIKMSAKLMAILKRFSPVVEQFSIDEAYLDASSIVKTIDDAEILADKIRETVKSELKITVSAGVATNKGFAKIASDLNKPDNTSVIKEEDLKTLVWKLPVEKIMGVGSKTKSKLNNVGIYTIESLAESQLLFIENLLGKNGRALWKTANGMDDSIVTETSSPIKGIGNSVTVPKDIVNYFEANSVLMALSESVGKRLRDAGLEAKVIEITIKDKNFISYTRQKTIHSSTDLTIEIYNEAVNLLKANWKEDIPIRLLGIRATKLSSNNNIKQQSLFHLKDREKQSDIDAVMDYIRDKFGYNSVFRGAVLLNNNFNLIKGLSDEDNFLK